eukprot:scaffold39792_cov82-Phaeocystis_antarctica.AAC.3
MAMVRCLSPPTGRPGVSAKNVRAPYFHPSCCNIPRVTQRVLTCCPAKSKLPGKGKGCGLGS